MHALNESFQLGIEFVGGKAYNLSILMANGYLVKSGLVFSGREVADIAATTRVDQTTIEEIRLRLDTYGGLAVRSSAVGEDGTTASFAGLYKTELYVSVEQLEQAIVGCASVRNSSFIAQYARSVGVEAGDLALIVQEMVDAEFAGVLFTANPVTGSRDEMVIEAVNGVGEALVSGHVAPRHYRARVSDGAILETAGADSPALAADDIAHLVTLGSSIRDLFGHEQDIEWAKEKRTGRIYILQSRNITALRNGLETESVNAVRETVIATTELATAQELERLYELGISVSHDVYSDQNIAELLTPHPSTMTFSLFNTIFGGKDGAINCGRGQMGYAIDSKLNTGLFVQIAGQPRCSIVHDALTYRIEGFALPDYAKLVNHYLTRIDEDARLANYPEVVLYNQNPSEQFLTDMFGAERAADLGRAYEKFFRGLAIAEDSFDATCTSELIPSWQEKLANYRANMPQTVRELTERFAELHEMLRTNLCVVFVKAARLGFFAYSRLRNHLNELFGAEGESYLNILTAGIPPERNPNIRFNIALHEANVGKRDLESIRNEYGHLALHELEISVPRHAENPGFLEQLVSQSLNDPSVELAANEMNSAVLLAELAEIIPNPRGILGKEVALARTYLSLREIVKFEYLKGYHLMRQTLERLEKLLGWEEGLIYNLTASQVLTADDNWADLERSALENRASHQKYHEMYVPTVLDSRALDEIGNEKSRGDEEGLNGFGVTNVVVEGVVVVMHSYHDEESLRMLKPGMILVTTTTDPAWSPILSLLGKNGGLVTEIGGVLAHGAIYAREMGLAAVLNVRNATKILKTGMRVRVNGPKGRVEIL